MKIQEVVHFLEQIAPLGYQESYDNAGLIVGDPNETLQGVLVCLDSTEAVIEEAIAKGCNLVVSHHPIVFSGLKRLNGNSYIERVVIKAIQNKVAIYAAHTNLDNVRAGVNAKIAEKLGLQNTQILAPKRQNLRKLFTFVPTSYAETVRSALFAAGAGHIGNYDWCSFNTSGEGTFRGQAATTPFVGEAGNLHTEPEVKIEVIYRQPQEGSVLRALLAAHPYEEVAYDVVVLENTDTGIGAGLIGTLPQPMEAFDFLQFLKKTMKTDCIRYTKLLGKPIEKVAVCGGAGSFLLPQAMGKGASVFVTADFKYHQFFDADSKIIIADIGHYESEQFTIDLFFELLTKKFGSFAVYKTDVRTNPVNYL